jgi:starch phosphorylase
MTDPYKEWQVPERLARLKDLVYNLWWSWHPEARALFKEIDRNLWRTTYHNPVLLLQRSLPRLNELASDEGFLSRYDSVIRLFDEYLEDQYTWFARKYPQAKGQRVAYF